MGGVDSHDWLLEKHTITRIVDMAAVNTCVIYNMLNAEKKEYQRNKHIAIAHLKKGNIVQKQIVIPSYTISSRVEEIDNVRRDGVGHKIGKRGKKKDDVKCKIVRENLLHFA
ncbi:hypothetical protein NPIL_529271 [Nephila pilipes]|uniref:Uncharacterized protein n=1 Tax=Nephila pilipes TaxID=299642 RepID=A0A8X6PXG3_NEPPI|nr:hypothetical protein NPIL_529271 [Nephila pilipes]